jgi:hypothetical protein
VALRLFVTSNAFNQCSFMIPLQNGYSFMELVRSSEKIYDPTTRWTAINKITKNNEPARSWREERDMPVNCPHQLAQQIPSAMYISYCHKALWSACRSAPEEAPARNFKLANRYVNLHRARHSGGSVSSEHISPKTPDDRQIWRARYLGDSLDRDPDHSWLSWASTLLSPEFSFNGRLNWTADRVPGRGVAWPAW